MDPTAEEPEGSSKPRINRRKPKPRPQPDLKSGFELGIHKFKIESKESRLEIIARLEADKVKLAHDLRKDLDLFRFVMGVVFVVMAACIFLVASNRYSPIIQNAAMAILAGIVSGGVGYATGKSSK